MERSKYIIAIVLSFFIVHTLQANFKSDIYAAYINGNMNKWKNIIDLMNLQQTRSNEFLIELINYQYGYIGWSIGNNKNEEAYKYLDLAENNLKILEKAMYKSSIVNSYKSAFYGFQISLNKFKAPFIGPKSLESAKLAVKQDEMNPLGYIQYGNCQFYMPTVFGGSKSEALVNFRKAEQLMELNGMQVAEDWNYLSLLTLIGQTYLKLKNYRLAKVYYDKALKVEPRFLWVKNELYPELLSKYKN